MRGAGSTGDAFRPRIAYIDTEAAGGSGEDPDPRAFNPPSGERVKGCLGADLSVEASDPRRNSLQPRLNV